MKQCWSSATALLRTVITSLVLSSFRVGPTLSLWNQTRSSIPTSLWTKDVQSQWPSTFPPSFYTTPQRWDLKDKHRSSKRSLRCPSPTTQQYPRDSRYCISPAPFKSNPLCKKIYENGSRLCLKILLKGPYDAQKIVKIQQGVSCDISNSRKPTVPRSEYGWHILFETFALNWDYFGGAAALLPQLGEEARFKSFQTPDELREPNLDPRDPLFSG